MGVIQILPPEEARKIAAGEVIDRPAALIREFMDNALDSGAALVEVSIEGGGIIAAEVSDDGSGMSREDLELCCLTHATSKIRSLSDLDSAQTLGFRGEALAAAAAVSRVEILTSSDGREAWKLETREGGGVSLTRGRRVRGTSVRAKGLFDAIPARKRFLKRAGSEAAACYQIFCEKALAFPMDAFRFFTDGKLKIFLPPDSSYRERFGRLFLLPGEARFLHEITAIGQGFQVVIVAGGPELFRQDRRRQFVIANGRRIEDFSLLQALEYGMRGVFPNGAHPVGAVFVTVDPGLADFNIHPAKREARFSDAASIHHAITGAIEDFRRKTGNLSLAREPEETENAPPAPGLPDAASPGAGISPALSLAALAARDFSFAEAGVSAPAARAAYAAVAERDAGYAVNPALQEKDVSCHGIRLVGRLFDLFILVERGDKLFVIDQHAAHERVLYDRFIRGPVPRQELLVAIPFTTESDADDAFLQTKREDLAALGIRVEKDGDSWRIEALPADWRLSDRETVREILSLKTAGRNLAERWAATLSCKAAVKDHDILDSETALALAVASFSLPDPHCPHGRPVWVEISRQTLLSLVKRV